MERKKGKKDWMDDFKRTYWSCRWHVVVDAIFRTLYRGFYRSVEFFCWYVVCAYIPPHARRKQIIGSQVLRFLRCRDDDEGRHENSEVDKCVRTSLPYDARRAPTSKFTHNFRTNPSSLRGFFESREKHRFFNVLQALLSVRLRIESIEIFSYCVLIMNHTCT